ncbi:efflux RND transporter permease subunit [Pyxidicoccus xibeiensis]|uniref:efflux RND transporter permease subunit n=1 Tax=Pyxidicoccus xibeiensis TaxID=2906759 RepID=UPI0020A7C375|nr:efflux RND transporter permease subunit [Pyxidicoccus xibeiensis]MCP3140711.1 efflux RND transporter permease subunit [Pyxidicoccus xibeiensis]
MSDGAPGGGGRRGGLSALAVRRPIGTMMLALTAVVLGFFFLLRMPVDLLPSITYPRIGVRLDAPGISPEVAVEEITRPLEEALAATEGVVQVYSQTREGRVSVDLYFQPGGDVDQALNDATAAVNRARGNLPDTIEQPRLFKVDPSQQPVVEFALTSPGLSGKALRVFADEELARELAVVPGVASVDVSGGAVEEVQVNLDLQRLQASGLGLLEVLQALEAENQDVSGGRLEGQRTESLVRTVGRFRKASELAKVSFLVPAPQAAAGTPVLATAPPQQRRVMLGELATIVDGTEDERVFVTLNGQPAVKVSVQKQPDANTVDVVDAVKAKVEELRGSGRLPEGAVLTATLDESVFIKRSIRDVAFSGLAGAALAAAVVLLFLGSLRQTFLVVLAIPLGTLLSVCLLALSGASLNIFSLGGLAVGIGAVDSCIVVLENIVRGVDERRRRRTGEGAGAPLVAPASTTESAPEPDAATGTSEAPSDSEPLALSELVPLAESRSTELESALVASTTTNLVAVVPFLLIGGFVALLFNELILTVLFTVGASLLTALTVVPSLAARLLAVRRTSGLSRLKVMRAFAVRVERLTDRYASLLWRTLQHRRWVLAGVFGGLGLAALLMLPFLSTEILPRVGTGQARLIAQFPPGQPVSESQRLMKQVDALLMSQPDVSYVFSTVGGFLFGNATSENPLRASSTITLKQGTDTQAFVARMNKELAKLNLVDIRLRLSPEQIRGLITSNSPVRAEVDVVLTGDDTEALQRAGRQVLEALDASAKLARFRPDADPTQSEIQVRRDAERAGLLGLSSGDIGQAVATALEGSIATQLQRGERLVDVRVRLAPESLRTQAQLEQLPLVFSGRAPVRLSEVATVTEGTTPGEVQRINQREVFILAGDLAEGESLGDALAETERIVAGVKLPQGVSLLPSNAAQSNRELQSSLAILGALAVFLVLTVMAVQYDSLIDPFVILFTIPLALVGGLAGLVLTGVALGATALIGAVLLVGIIVGNGIILVELANQLREESPDMSRLTAMRLAAPMRLRPILITTLLATLGLVPLAIGFGEGTELLRPLALVTLFGLGVGTLLTLFVVPCLYVSLHALMTWRPGARKAAG